MSEGSRFNPAAIEMLRRVGGERLAKKMAEMFRRSAPAKMAAARSAAERLDAAALALAAHSLKSSSGQIGASRLQEICADLETQVASEASRDWIERMLDVADSEVKEASEWLAQQGL